MHSFTYIQNVKNIPATFYFARIESSSQLVEQSFEFLVSFSFGRHVAFDFSCIMVLVRVCHAFKFPFSLADLLCSISEYV